MNAAALAEKKDVPLLFRSKTTEDSIGSVPHQKISRSRL
jgi:hypothetical protein